jgi:hypothetical protein
VTLPPANGKKRDRVRGSFTISRPGDYSVFTGRGGSGLDLRLTGGGRTIVTLEWVPIPVQGDGTPEYPTLPDGYWTLTHITYRFERKHPDSVAGER